MTRLSGLFSASALSRTNSQTASRPYRQAASPPQSLFYLWMLLLLATITAGNLAIVIFGS
jgi:hypothetical protein